MADDNSNNPAAAKPPAAAARVDNTARRTWDLDEFRGRAAARDEKAAAAAAAVGTKAGAEAAANAAAELRRQKRLERDPLHQGLIAHRSNLKSRDRELDLEARLGKQQMVVAGAAPSQQAGYYCSVCDCTLRDSQSYLDHINGKFHNRALGMSMRAERSTAEQVRQRLREASEAAKAGGGGGGKRRRGEGEGGGAGPSSSSLPRAPRGPGGALLLTGGEAPVPLRDGLAKDDGDDEERQGEEEGDDGDDDEGGAGLLPPGAEPYVPDGFESRVLEAQEREEREREERKRAKAEKKKQQQQQRAREEEEAAAGGGGGGAGEGEGGLDPALAAMMGFGGFGGGKKGR